MIRFNSERIYRPTTDSAIGPNQFLSGRLNQQTFTFVLSILAQVGTMVLGFFALTKDGLPDVLSVVIVLETAVQVIEFVWYAAIGLFNIGPCKQSFPPVFRYADWVLTTPTMLWSLYLLILWWSNPCQSNAEMLKTENLWWALVTIGVADWMMLLCGFLLEKESLTKRMPFSKQFLFCAGFAFLAAAFIPHLVTLRSHHSTEGVWLTVSTFIVWLLYGVVAAANHGNWYSEMIDRNTYYNLLDIASKNATGILIGIMALHWDPEKGCLAQEAGSGLRV